MRDVIEVFIQQTCTHSETVVQFLPGNCLYVYVSGMVVTPFPSEQCGWYSVEHISESTVNIASSLHNGSSIVVVVVVVVEAVL